MKNNIGNVIAEHRKKNGYSQITLAKKLEEYSIFIKNTAVSSWEKGNSTPTAHQLLALCEILGITDIYSEFIGVNPDDPFQDLNEEGIHKVYDYIDLLKKSGDYKKEVAEIIPFTSRMMKISLLSTSAGTGDYLDDENFEIREIFDKVPAKADFGVYLNGDSMEPAFKNDELVWIEQTEVLESGDIGLFYLDGMTYFKKYLKTKAGAFLTSLNPKYPPKQIQEYQSFKIFGKLAQD